MKIVLVSHGFFPEVSPRSYRATELAKEFAAQGHDTTVITIQRSPETQIFCKKHGITLVLTSRLWLKPIKTLPGRFSLLSRAINRILLMLIEYPDLELLFRFAARVKHVEGADLLISFAVPYPVHWGVAWVWKPKLAKCWIADCGDPYMGNESDSFKKLFYFKYVEKWLFRKAHFIAIPIEGAQQAYYKEFWSKIVVIPQGVNVDYFSRSRRSYQPNAIVTFGYAGTFIPGKRDPGNLMEYLINSEADYRFHIYTSSSGMVEGYERRSGGRITLNKPVPREELIGLLSTMDFLITVENSTTTQAPSKLIDYYLAGRPVLSVTTNQSNFTSLDSFLKRDFSQQVILSDFQKYDISVVSNQFLNLLGVKNSKG